MIKHFLCSDNKDAVILELDAFNKDALKDGIINALTEDKTDCISHEKTSLDKKRVGNDIINFYAVNPRSGTPSRLIFKGNKTYYKPLN